MAKPYNKPTKNPHLVPSDRLCAVQFYDQSGKRAQSCVPAKFVMDAVPANHVSAMDMLARAARGVVTP